MSNFGHVLQGSGCSVCTSTSTWAISKVLAHEDAWFHFLFPVWWFTSWLLCCSRAAFGSHSKYHFFFKRMGKKKGKRNPLFLSSPEQTLSGLLGRVMCLWWIFFFHFRNSETSRVCSKKDNHPTHEMLMSKMSRAIFTVRGRLIREPIPLTSRARWPAPAFCLRHATLIALACIYSRSNYFGPLVDKDKWGD